MKSIQQHDLLLSNMRARSSATSFRQFLVRACDGEELIIEPILQMQNDTSFKRFANRNLGMNENKDDCCALHQDRLLKCRPFSWTFFLLLYEYVCILPRNILPSRTSHAVDRLVFSLSLSFFFHLRFIYYLFVQLGNDWIFEFCGSLSEFNSPFDLVQYASLYASSIFFLVTRLRCYPELASQFTHKQLLVN